VSALSAWVLVLAIVGAAASCATLPLRSQAPQLTGTCEGACSHYLVCKGEGAPTQARQSCVRECGDIFVHEGQVDSASLRDFERLSCTEAVAFVEGNGGRGPASRPAQRQRVGAKGSLEPAAN
jgi:hypothetical protein